MKTTISSLLFILISTFCVSQNPIHTDTTITKTISLGESIELSFEDSPGTGYAWYLPVIHDSTRLSIQFQKQELMEGYKPVGGKYITTYKYTGHTNGTFLIVYSYGRPWLKEILKRCRLEIIVE
jgi:predicted secreted protein